MFPPFPQVCDRDRYRAGDTLTWGLVCRSTSSHREAAFLPEVQPLGPPPPWMLFKVTDRPPAASEPGIPANPKAPGTWSAQAHPTPPEGIHPHALPGQPPSCLMPSSCSPPPHPEPGSPLQTEGIIPIALRAPPASEALQGRLAEIGN